MPRVLPLDLLGVAFFLLIIAMQIFSIFQINYGHFVYTLDDPYIHLALAENIWRGHYGVNVSEFSAPSSSVIWPFILAPFAQFELAPLIINLIASCWAIMIFNRALDLSLNQAPVSFGWRLFFLIAYTLITNLVGAALTGMEHSVQILCATAAGFGLVKLEKTGVIAPWLFAVIILGPLVRYENIAISAAVLGYLMLSRHYVSAIVTGVLMLIPLALFSAYLLSIGMDAMPSSINAKSDLVSGYGGLSSVFLDIISKLLHPHGIFLFVCIVVLYFKAKQISMASRSYMLHALTLAVVLHFVAGKVGWLNRYELYILAFALPLLAHLFSSSLLNRISSFGSGQYRFTKLKLGGIAFFVSGLYVLGLPALTISSNNIFEQQYQMHRLATEFYQKPIAVNDLGYISYQNDEYILDLWGLASIDALNLRQQDKTASWIQPLIEEKQVDLAIIYDKWFEKRPKEWIKVATMETSRPGIIIGDTQVSMYATHQASIENVTQAITAFKQSLPKEVKLTIH